MIKTCSSFKQIIFVFTLLSFINKANSREFKPTYDRSSVSVCFLTYGNRYIDNLSASYVNLPFLDRYNVNPINEPFIDWSNSIPEKKGESLNKYDELNRIAFATNILKEFDFGKQIVKRWYNYQPGAGFSLDTIFSRAKYNATKEEYEIASKTKRGEALIKDYGFNLVSESYVFFIDLRELEKEVRNSEYGRTVEFKSSIGIYVYKLKFDDKEINDFYKLWIYKSDTEETIKNKLEKFEQMFFDFDLSFSKKTKLVVGSSYMSKADMEQISSSKADKLMSEYAFDNMVQEIYEAVNIFVPKKVEALRLKTYINRESPIAAKIGKKESLKVDDKFGVYEYKWDDKNKKAMPNLKAVVRVKNVGDNTTSTDKESEYYKINFGDVKQGMLLREFPYSGISVMAEYYPAGGFGASMFYRGKRNIPALYGSGSINFKAAPDYEIKGATLDSTAFKLGLGIAKGYQLGIFELIGQTEFTLSSYLFKIENNPTYQNLFAETSNFGLDFSAMIGINFTHYLQIYANYCFYSAYLYSPPKLYDGETELSKDVSIDMPWGNKHPYQGKPLLKLGLRYEF